ncbi:HATPase_c domain protein [Mucor ambiguus]|uniref:HATPase_c domain protein n=1 Tax=Mucor ambiguus TaxID=91626 RepID=A0A0C9MGG6_9FUNG|nr:HATPase_c domain protein [Mucor ambiguus]
MSSHLDNRLELLRSNVMDTGGVEEKVEVNQRHLIDKILARYSAEYVLYRELMQNADDASSTSISIHFHSTSPDTTKPPNLQAKCDKVIFKNNGMAFRPEDWQRLKRIAEGNPDEQKIGAFGVGFYSLFSVCENPFVFSGSQCMAFYFKGDQLFAKRADVPDKDIDPWTSFLMDLREPMEMPDFDHFSRFLTTSMGFTANLKQVAVYFDDQPIFKITKREAEPRSMAIDARKMMLTTPQRMFTITGADMRQIQLDAEKYTPPTLFTPLTNFLSSKSKPTSSSNNDSRNEKGLPVERASIFLRVVAGALKVSVSRDFEKEMERATKKKPPSATKFQLVYTGKEELDASENGNQIFKDLIPFPHQGRVFIGFPTHQTTGCCCHMASRFIPTVERESIDFADRYISVWNKELLAAGGLLARMVYNDEMAQIARLYRELVGFDAEVDKIKAEEQKDSAKIMLEKRAAHALHSFTFQHSTPSTVVSKLQEEQFFASCKAPLDVMTSHGIQPITIARSVPDYTSVKGSEITKLLDGFVKTIPTITPTIQEDCKESITKLTKYSLLVPLGFNDVLKELDTRSLEEKEMVCCLKWWFKCNKNDECIPRQTRDHVINNAIARQRFLEAAIMNRGEECGLLQLSRIRWFLNPKTIPVDMPFPQDTMPITVSAGLSQADMINYLGNMNELTVLHWVQFIAQSNAELETSKDFAERVLVVASKGYVHASSAKIQADLVQILGAKRCVPTRFGMKLPQDAYFSSVKLFDDLPIVDFSKKNINDAFLAALGIRKHVELQMVFDRLISDGSWSHVDLVKYLASEATTLSDIEIKRLRETAIFTKEGEEPRLREISKPSGALDSEGKPIMEKQTKKVYKRYRAGDLFAPTDIVRDLNLPTIYWTRMPRWRPDSAEARFLERLGLNIKPPLASLLLLAAPDTNMTTERVAIQRRALTYLIENRQDYNDTYNVNTIQIKFLPCSDGKTYAAPKECYSNPDVQLLGFQVLHSDFSSVCDKLGVRENPPSDKLIAAFVDKLETNHDAARKIFEYMATRMGEFSRGQWDLLRQLAFIPVQGKQGSAQLYQPSQVYFETDTSAMTFHKELFVYVSFGAKANPFLRTCGVKNEPTTAELAALLVKDPQRYWELSGGGERYIEVLRQIAGQYNMIKTNRQLLNDMKTKPFLVGTKRTTLSEQQQQQEKLDNGEDVAEEEFVQYRLAKASDIFINNDTMAQQIFSPLSAPMEEVLEDFYVQLGSKMLSSQIRETYSYATHLGVTKTTKKITGMIFERAPIGIYQMLNDGLKKKKDLLRDEKYIKQHLKVTQVKDLKIVRTFRHTNEKNIQPTTACADLTNFQLYVSDANDIDYYDIAHSLCRLIFARASFNDAIVMERYLTTSLYNLRRKNVPVDRILNIKKRQDASPAYTPTPTPPPASNTTNQLQRAPATPPPNMPKPLSPKELDTYTKQVKEVFGDCQDAYIRQLLSQQHSDHAQNVITRLLREDYPKVKAPGQDLEKSIVSEEEELKKQIEAAAAQQRLQAKAERASGGFMNKILGSWRSGSSSPAASSPPSHPPTQTASSHIANEITKQIEESSQKPKLPKPDQTITPNFTANIQQNLKRAIHSCKPYAGQDIYSPPRINQVNESSTYCDSGSGQDLTYVGNVMGMEFFVHRTVHPDDVLQQYGQPMARFNSILNALAHVFELKLTTIQIYYDTEGPTIAFNLSGSLFMNLRYYLALHDTTDKEQESSKRKEALIYWFMTLCHELAHNFVGQHDSTHEFYMSSFAETYLESLMNHIYGSTDRSVTDLQPPAPAVAKTNPSLDLLD